MKTIFFLVMAVACAYQGYQENVLASVAQSRPTNITAAELEANGPGDNAFIVLEDFLALTSLYIVEYEGDDEAYTKVWLPITPLDGEYHQQLADKMDEEGNFEGKPPLPEKMRIILKSNQIKSEDQVIEVTDRDTVWGMVINEIEELGRQEKALLVRNYPGIDFDDVYIIEHGRRPAGSGTVIAFFVAAIILGTLSFLQYKYAILGKEED